MKRAKRVWAVMAAGLFLLAGISQRSLTAAEKNVPRLPRFFLNGQPATLTIQDLSGFGTRPLRLLVERNNRKHHEELIQTYALGAREGEDLGIEMAAPLAGMRVTLYKILQEPDGPDTNQSKRSGDWGRPDYRQSEENKNRSGSRYLSMPSSVYFDKPGQTLYRENTGLFREAFFIIVYEKTDSPDEKEINVRYFEERVRKLSIAAKTNFLFSSLKLKMKDFSDLKAGEFFERDAQLLVDRLIDPRRIFLVRIWKAAKPASEMRKT